MLAGRRPFDERRRPRPPRGHLVCRARRAAGDPARDPGRRLRGWSATRWPSIPTTGRPARVRSRQRSTRSTIAGPGWTNALRPDERATDAVMVTDTALATPRRCCRKASAGRRRVMVANLSGYRGTHRTLRATGSRRSHSAAEARRVGNRRAPRRNRQRVQRGAHRAALRRPRQPGGSLRPRHPRRARPARHGAPVARYPSGRTPPRAAHGHRFWGICGSASGCVACPLSHRRAAGATRRAAMRAGAAPTRSCCRRRRRRRSAEQFVLTRCCSVVARRRCGARWRPFVVVADAQQDRLDQMRDSQDLTAFTGRDGELAAVTEAFAEARAGHGRLVTISGEAGLGKSRLLLEFRRTIDPASVTTVDRPLLVVRAGHSRTCRSCRRCGSSCSSSRSSGRNGRTLTSRPASERRRPDLEHFLPYYLRLLSIASETYRAPGPTSERSSAASSSRRRWSVCWSPPPAPTAGAAARGLALGRRGRRTRR